MLQIPDAASKVLALSVALVFFQWFVKLQVLKVLDFDSLFESFGILGSFSSILCCFTIAYWEAQTQTDDVIPLCVFV